MRVVDSARYPALREELEPSIVLEAIREHDLRSVVEQLSYPRNFYRNRSANLRAGAWIAESFRTLGYDVTMSGPDRNVVATHRQCPSGPRILVGSHYDTVPDTPGADDNASAVAVSLVCARALSVLPEPVPVVFVSFNREEDGLLGSRQFVAEHLPTMRDPIAVAHILEMVGYCSHEAGSQRLPAGLPIRVPEIGDFLALLSNRTSNHLVKPLLLAARSHCDELHVLGVRVYLGLEKYFPHLLRSDHAPFWQAKIPAMMWTDTSEFRNPHYHLRSDTPESLDYGFMTNVAQLLLWTILEHAKQ